MTVVQEPDRSRTLQTTTHGAADRPTMLAVAVVAYVAANVLHEGLGHGGACLAAGCEPQTLTTAYFEGDMSGSSELGRRLIAAGGTAANLAAGLVCWWLLRRAVDRSGVTRCFLWWSMTVNLLVAAGYPLFSGLIGIGDWVVVGGGGSEEPSGAARALLAATGAVLYAGAVWVSLRALASLVGSGTRDAVRRGVRWTVLPYVAGSGASTLGAAFNPAGAALIATSAAAHFGGTSALAWMARLLGMAGFGPADGDPVRVVRSWAWIVAAVVVLVLHVAVLGPGVRFSTGGGP